MLLYVHRDRIRDGESRTATSTFTQLLSSEILQFIYVHRDRKDYYGRGAQDGHLDNYTVTEFCIEAPVSSNNQQKT